MEMNTEARNLRLAENLIMLDGEGDSIIVGNGYHYNPMYIENGKAFRALLHKIDCEGIGLIEDELLELLQANRIIVRDSEIKRTPPKRTNTCCGVIGEQTLVLPLGENIKDEVYDKALDYQLAIIENNGVLNINFYGLDPVSCWSLIEKVTMFVKKKRVELKQRIGIRYHLESQLSDLPNDMFRWVKKHYVTFTVFLPLPLGLKELPPWYDGIMSNVKKLSKEGIQICFVTPVTKNNIDDLLEIGKYYASISNTAGFEFPAIQNYKHCWKYENANDLPDPEEYSQVLIGLYNASYVCDDLFSPVNELRHRITNGGYLSSCSCVFNHVTVVGDNGDISPCVKATNCGVMCIGNIKSDPECNIQNSFKEYDDIKTKSWGKCKQCKWLYLCGGHCPLSSDSEGNGTPTTSENLIKEYVCEPRVRLLKSIIYDIVNNVAISHPKTP